MSALLTDEAVQAARHPMLLDGAQRGIEAFLRHHRTVGREALVEKVARAICVFHWEGEEGWTHYRPMAEAVVTALVGEKP